MPSVRKLTQDEVKALENRGKGQRKLIEEEYDGILNEYSIGDYGVADLGDSEKRMTVRNRLKAAAGRRKLALEFRRTKGPQLRFRVMEAGGAPSKPAPARKKATAGAAPVAAAPEPEKPARKRGGRKKAAAA
jgi:hypothetical protein